MGLGHQTSGPNLSDPLLPHEALVPQGPITFPDSATSQGTSAEAREPVGDTSQPTQNCPPLLPTGCVVSLPLFATFMQRSTHSLFYSSLCLSCQRGLKKLLCFSGYFTWRNDMGHLGGTYLDRLGREGSPTCLKSPWV